jgi:hypothetical protein
LRKAKVRKDCRSQLKKTNKCNNFQKERDSRYQTLNYQSSVSKFGEIKDNCKKCRNTETNIFHDIYLMEAYFYLEIAFMKTL